MSDQEMLEWRNVNAHRSYPLVDNDIVPKDFILDAILFMDGPVTLTRVEYTGGVVKIETDKNVYWEALGDQEYIYNDYGKLVLGVIPEGEYIYNVKFLDTVCTRLGGITLLGSHEEVVLDCKNSVSDNTIEISLDETPEFNCDCITTINGQPALNGHFTLTGDECNQLLPQNGQITINDICLPSCYGCDDRLTVGDVHLYMTELEARATALEPTP